MCCRQNELNILRERGKKGRHFSVHMATVLVFHEIIIRVCCGIKKCDYFLAATATTWMELHRFSRKHVLGTNLRKKSFWFEK